MKLSVDGLLAQVNQDIIDAQKLKTYYCLIGFYEKVQFCLDYFKCESITISVFNAPNQPGKKELDGFRDNQERKDLAIYWTFKDAGIDKVGDDKEDLLVKDVLYEKLQHPNKGSIYKDTTLDKFFQGLCSQEYNSYHIAKKMELSLPEKNTAFSTKKKI